MKNSKTLYDKLWEEHFIPIGTGDDAGLIYIDRHLIHEVTSPQAFEGLKLANRKLWRTKSNLAVVDHNVPTVNRNQGIADAISKIQVDTLNSNALAHGIKYFNLLDERQGIVHVIGPEQGATLPGMTVVCGDSHTSTHGALACLAFGIGTSEVEHVLATQCIRAKKLKNMLLNVTGSLKSNVCAKDLILYIIGKIGIAGGTGHAIEFGGTSIRNISVEGRMTMCNMAIEAGARSGLVAFDSKTEHYVKGKPLSPKGVDLREAIAYWKTLKSDEGAFFDKTVEICGEEIRPQVTWGTAPDMVDNFAGKIPDPDAQVNSQKKESFARALSYMDLKPNTPIKDISVDKIFIGSCTNSRIEDFRNAAKILVGRRVSRAVKQALVVPGSGLVKKQAENEGLKEVFLRAGFEWRDPGCSMCLGMNPDKLNSGERCASTSNRNFEGRQGSGGRTHLMSPTSAAAAAIAGKLVDAESL
ncbi:MAG: 3-isopropylmalate dehydratase large subunit [Betaproteobacteria bacterium TMED82]|nr:MAG: 3-isopropylmalate dehydratase large subunit [Betaproteobacteria bacterium TMED82]|tara:strand:+ start:9682 stop:11091 length:1410 start_codon:yes stop_codon:yes gene_type:complete